MAIARQTFTSCGTFTVQPGVTEVTVIASKYYPGMLVNGISQFTMAINPLGGVYSWGENVSGVLGIGSITNQCCATLVCCNLAFKNIYSGGGSTESVFGITSGGIAYAWGLNDCGQLGLGNVTNACVPTVINGGVSFASIYTSRDGGGTSVLGLTPGGKLYAWGNNDCGQLGIGSVSPVCTPTPVCGNLTFSKIIMDSSGASVIGITADTGLAYGWGQNNNGQLGLGDILSRCCPTQICCGINFTQIALAIGRTWGLTCAGVMYGWGANSSGELGIKSITNACQPSPVCCGFTFCQMATNGDSIIALTSNGTPYGWGNNTVGQNGHGDITNKCVPSLLNGGLQFSKIYGGGNSGNNDGYLGLTSAGVAYGWGRNVAGVLGIGSCSPVCCPTAVMGGLTFYDLYSGNGNMEVITTFGVTTSGLLYAWGGNGFGQLGVGDATPRCCPTLVLKNILPNLNPVMKRTTITVTPGSSYVINPAGYYSFFGSVPVSDGPVDSIVVEFDQ